MEDEESPGRGRKQAKGTGRESRKAKLLARSGPARAGGVTAFCGCRYVRSGGAWRHITPCRAHRLADFVTDEAMLHIGSEAFL